MYIYIYIFLSFFLSFFLSLSLSVYIHIYIYIYTCRGIPSPFLPVWSAGPASHRPAPKVYLCIFIALSYKYIVNDPSLNSEQSGAILSAAQRFAPTLSSPPHTSPRPGSRGRRASPAHLPILPRAHLVALPTL